MAGGGRLGLNSIFRGEEEEGNKVQNRWGGACGCERVSRIGEGRERGTWLGAWWCGTEESRQRRTEFPGQMAGDVRSECLRKFGERQKRETRHNTVAQGPASESE